MVAVEELAKSVVMADAVEPDQLEITAALVQLVAVEETAWLVLAVEVLMDVELELDVEVDVDKIRAVLLGIKTSTQVVSNNNNALIYTSLLRIAAASLARTRLNSTVHTISLTQELVAAKSAK
jgi:hypothetical protein